MAKFYANSLNISGRIVEHNLEVRQNKNGDNYISGSVVVRAKDGSDISVRAFSNELTKAGAMNKNFLSLLNVKEQFTSIANCREEGEATLVRLEGARIESNMFLSKEGNVAVGKTIKCNSFKEATNYTKDNAEFALIGIISGFRDVMNENQPTGDMYIDLEVYEVNEYNGRKVTLTESVLYLTKDMVEGFKQAGFAVGQLCRLNGIIQSVAQEIVKNSDTAWGEVPTFSGKPQQKFVVRGGNTTVTDVPFTPQEVQECHARREQEKVALKNGEQANQQAPQQAPANAFGTQTPPQNAFGSSPFNAFN